jgi:endonuclease YncB( thermonuclease family)
VIKKRDCIRRQILWLSTLLMLFLYDMPVYCAYPGYDQDDYFEQSYYLGRHVTTGYADYITWASGDTIHLEDDAICGLTEINGRFQGAETLVMRREENKPEFGNSWIMRSIDDRGRDVRGNAGVRVRCIKTDRFDYWGRHVVNVEGKRWVIGMHPRITEFEGQAERGDPRNIDMWGDDSFRFLTGIAGKLNGIEMAKINEPETNSFGIHKMAICSESWDWHVKARAACVAPRPGMHQERISACADVNDNDVYLMHYTEGVCFLTGVMGQFNGYGEGISIKVDEYGNQILHVESLTDQCRSEDKSGCHIKASAVCIPFKIF